MQNPFGLLAPFDPNECQFSFYVDRFEQHCRASRVTEETKKIALFITVLDNSHYQLLTNMMYTDELSSVRKLNILVERLEAHSQPQTIEVAE